MKKFLKIFIPILLILAIIGGTYWYLFIYDREFTRDMLLGAARYYEAQGDLEMASWFYDQAYLQSDGSDEIAIELANQYIESGNYTQAEVALNKAIRDGGGVSVYVALCKTYVAQDKLLDAVDLLDKVQDPVIKAQLDQMRPMTPATEQTPGFYNQYISVAVGSNTELLFVSANGQYPSVVTDRYTDPITLVDGENVLYAIAVADNGLVSSMAIFGYTVGGVIEEVIFADPAIEAVIREQLLVPANKVLYSNDLWGIKEFTIPAGAADYSDLRHLAYLEELVIEGGVANQLSVLQNFTMLHSLHISNTLVSTDELSIIGSISTLENLTLNNCGIANISALANLTQLKALDLGNNAIRNIESLASMPLLKQLSMASNALQNISALSACSSLSILDISYNSVTDISPLGQLSQLSIVYLGHNLLTDISALGQVTGLTELAADNNQIADISALKQCTNLTYVDISYNTVTDISALTGIASLAYLDFSNNSVSKLPKWISSGRLITIDGSYNQISDLSGLSGLSHLNHIFMDYNANISSVASLANCPVLIQVNVFGTKVKDVSMLTEQSIIVNYNPVA